jgi:phosphonoacetate hydrolase
MQIELNGIAYAAPKRPLAVVCIDGGDPAYLAHGFEAGIVPNIRRFADQGFHAVADGSMPSFTCPNNMSIVTGAPPAVHGISGNFYLDRASGEPVVMTGPELLRGHSIMAAFSRAGLSVVSITAKDKLRQQLQKGMDLARGAISFSSQQADRCTLAENGIEDVLGLLDRPLPDMYSAELSLFVLDAGIRLLETRRPALLYLSLTDFIQHAHAPGHPEADRFYAEMDRRFGRLAELGALVALTADHGMADKADDDGHPNVIWLQDELDRAFGAGRARVICPITDAFVGHHGALGGFVRVYCADGLAPQAVAELARDLEGVARAWLRPEVAAELEQPLDREGDVAVMGDAVTVLGGREEEHDLSALKGHRLRTHGSLTEARVPFILSEPLTEVYAERAAQGGLKSHQLFDYALNGVA